MERFFVFILVFPRILFSETRDSFVIDSFNDAGTQGTGQDYGTTINTEPPSGRDCCSLASPLFYRNVEQVWGGRREAFCRNQVSQGGGAGTIDHDHDAAGGFISTTVTNQVVDDTAWSAFLVTNYRRYDDEPVLLGDNPVMKLSIRRALTTDPGNLIPFTMEVYGAGAGVVTHDGHLAESNTPFVVEVPLGHLARVDRISFVFGIAPGGAAPTVASRTLDLDQIELVFDEIPDGTPTDIILSSTGIRENQPIDSLLGSLDATDPDEGDTFVFDLVNGAGDSGNASFVVSNGNELRSTVSFDADVEDRHQIRVRVTDSNGLALEKAFSITVIDDLTEDVDGDGLPESVEDLAGTSDLKSDTDGDGVSDPDEIAAGTDPLDSSYYPLPFPAPGGASQDIFVSFGRSPVGGAWNIASAAVLNSEEGIELLDGRLNPTGITLQGFGSFSESLEVSNASDQGVDLELGFGWNGGQAKGWIHPFAVHDFIVPNQGEQIGFKFAGLDPIRKYSLAIQIAHPTAYSTTSTGAHENPFSPSPQNPRRAGLGGDISEVDFDWLATEGWNEGGWMVWDEIQVGDSADDPLIVGGIGIKDNDLVILAGGLINALYLRELEAPFSEVMSSLGVAGDTSAQGDLNNDGISNAIGYSLGLPPNEVLSAQERSRLPAMARVAALPAMKLGIPENAPDDVTYCVEAATNLGPGGWTEIARKEGDGGWIGGASVEEGSPAAGAIPTTIGYPPSFAGEGAAFMRLRVVIAGSD